ncbi:MAG: GAF domain-containing protein [bacterium]|nr:GAF domain-containing protein [bacterium]
MNIKDIMAQLTSELKKDPLEKNAIVNNINSLIASYNTLVNSVKAKTETPFSSEIESLKKEISESEKKYKKKVIDLYTIFEIAQDLSSSLNVDNLINTIILTSLGHLLVENGSIFVFNEKTGKFVFKQAKGIKTGMEKIELDSQEEIIKFTISKTKPFLRTDFLTEKNNAQYHTLFSNLNCELVIPFRIKNKVNGILFLGPKPGNIPFSESNTEFLTALGNFAAIALENAKLYTDLNNKVRDLSALYNISKEINKSDDTNIVLDLMLETITTGFGVKKCSLILYDDLKNHYHIERSHNLEQAEAVRFLDMILSRKIENALDKNEPVFIKDDRIMKDHIFFSIPLIAGSKKVGLLNIYQFDDDIIIDDDIKQIFVIIASQMAPPIVLTFFLSKRETYKENPFDYIYNDIDTLITKSRESGISFILCRLKLIDKEIEFNKVKSIIEKIKTILQPTDSLIHSNFNELLLIFSVSTKEEVENLIRDFIQSMVQIEKIEPKIACYPDDGDNVNTLLKQLYNN